MPRKSNQLVVYGAGGHAKTVLATLEAQGQYGIIGLLDDDESRHGTAFYGYPILGGREQLKRLRKQGLCRAVVAVGDNFRRAELARLLKEQGFQLVPAIHPTATLLRGSRIGEGAVVLVNAFVGADATIGDNAIVSVGVVVGHDSIVGSWVQLAPGVCLGGEVKVGDFSLVGLGASVLPRVTVGRQVVVGANAVVIDDLPDGVTAVGIPARIIKRRITQA